MRINVTIPAFALKEIYVDVGKLLKSIHFDILDDRIVVKAQTLGKVEITMRFRPMAEEGKLILQDPEIEGALGLAHMSESLIMSKIQKALEANAEKVFIHDVSIASEKIYLSFTPRQS